MLEKMDAFFASMGLTGDDLIWFWLGSIIFSCLMMGGILWIGGWGARHARKRANRHTDS